MEATKASESSGHLDEDNTLALPVSSAPSGPYPLRRSEHSSSNQHGLSHTPLDAPLGSYQRSNPSSNPGRPYIHETDSVPLSLPGPSSLPFQTNSRALQSTLGSQVSTESHIHANHLLHPNFRYNRQVDYQPPATRQPYATPRSSLYDREPSPDETAQVSSDSYPNNSTLVSRPLPLPSFQSEQNDPQYPTIQRPFTGRRPRPTNPFDSRSTSSGIPSARPLATSSSGLVNQGIFQGAHNFTMHNVVMNEYSDSETFMLVLLAETIQGAAFDSGRRYPPPRCLQGTRQATIDRTRSFISDRNQSKRIRCIIGPAGAGKSAIMQTLAESAFDEALLGASVFFADDCKDMSKIITTLAYQFAVNYEPYRPFIRDALVHDPGLPRQSLVVQFRKLIVEPFVHRIPRATDQRLLVLLDGLDRCKEELVCEILRLVSEFAIDYPTSPLTWVISCRAEPHIMMFLGGMKETYEEEVLELDGEDACRDVKYFLRYQLDAIKKTSFTLRRCRQWPEDCDITKIAEASKGFFAYANSVIKFVNDTKDKSPRSRLARAVQFISGDFISQINHLGTVSHPMSTLDTLYNNIMANIPNVVLSDARNLLLLMMHRPGDLHFTCNWLRITEEAAYNATYPLHSVLRIPDPEDAISQGLQCFHRSFSDYLLDFRRSAVFRDIKRLISQLDATCIRSHLSQIINGPRSVGPAHLDIRLSWPEGEHKHVGNISEHKEVRVKILERAAETTVLRLVENAFEFRDPFYAHALIAFDNDHLEEDPDIFRRLLFEDSRRPEFIHLGILKEMPLRMLNPADIDSRWLITCQFKCCATTEVKKPCRCGPFCPADWKESVEGSFVNRTADFFFNICSCSDRFIRQLEIRKAQFPDQLVTIFLNLKRSGWVEYRFHDPDNCGSEWTYYFYYTFPFTTYPFSAGPLTSWFPTAEAQMQMPYILPSSNPNSQNPTPNFSARRRTNSFSAYQVPMQIRNPLQPPPSNHTLNSIPASHSTRFSTQIRSVKGKGVKVKSSLRLLKGVFSSSMTTKHDFMSLLRQKTIQSSRSTTPCHSGTRLATLSRIRCFITDSKKKKRSYWIIGAAGSGKTTILHTIGENPPNNVTVTIPIFLPPGYNNEANIIKTIAYRLALHHEPYRQFIKDEITLDPSLLHKSLTRQFHQLIVKPFIHQLPHSPEDGCILILIDGLTGFLEHEETTRTLITLISDFCVRYSDSSLVWVLSSRPEPAIIDILNDVEGSYEKEEIDVNGTEACEDVQLFLRGVLNQVANTFLGGESSQWPSEGDLMKITGASQGFFGYAASVVEFIKASQEDPDSRLQQVLEVIDSGCTSGYDFERLTPTTLLEELYFPIVRRAPFSTAENVWPWLIKAIECSDSLHFICNWLGVTEEAVYSATDSLRSVLRVPEPGLAYSQGLECVHPSFINHIRCEWLWKWRLDDHDFTALLDGSCARRILEQAPNGTLKVSSGTVANIRLSWPPDFECDGSFVSGDEEVKLRMYKAAVKTTVSRMAKNEPEFEGPFYVRALTAFENECFEEDPHVFSRLLFDESRHSKFMEYGVLQEMSIGMISVTGIDERWPIRCQSKSSTSEGPNPCGLSCQVNWIKNDEKDQVLWTTENLIFGRCDCSKRIACQLEYEIVNGADRLLRVFINLHRIGFIEYQFAEDDGSEWIYHIPYSFM